MNGRKSVDSLYRINPETGRTIIEIALDDYMDFFHEWDNATFRKRDMHPELAEFLDLCSEDIPLKARIEIRFSVQHEAVDPEKEQMIRESYGNYYGYLDRVEFRKLRQIYKKVLLLFVVAMLFILLYVLSRRMLNGDVLSEVVMEGILIGGWVFMWEAFHMAFFEGQEPLRRNRELKRFLRADVGFRYGSGQGG